MPPSGPPGSARYARWPHREATGGPVPLADEFLRLACLTYGPDDPARVQRAQRLLDGNPGLGRRSIHAIAAAGAVDAARELLDRDPSLARAEGGPHDWEPLVYLAYSRLDDDRPGRSSLAVARLLLGAGADPNAGYLWEGLCPPFTALTGAFGRGEGDQPPHRHWAALARLLLEAGADPNDAQTLYNRQWDPDDAWLELLFEFGLGAGDGGPWHRLLAPGHPTPAQMLEDELAAAAHHGFAGRVKLLLGRGVHPDGQGTRHPVYAGRAPSQEAALSGHRDIVALLREAGMAPALDEVDHFVCAATAGDRAETERLRRAAPDLPGRAMARHPGQLVRAAEKNSLEAVALLIEVGFDVNAISRTAPLHEAAMRGNLDIIKLLLEHGADPTIRDRSFDATPAGWAEHHRQAEAARYLEQTAIDRR